MIEIIKNKSLRISKKSHLKILFRELYSIFKSWGGLEKSSCSSYISVMKEVESEFNNSTQQQGFELPRTVSINDSQSSLATFNDLVDLIEPTEYKKDAFEKQLIDLTKELEKKRKEEMHYINEHLNKNKNDENLIFSENENNKDKGDGLTHEMKTEIKLRKSMNNNSFKLLLWIMRKKKKIEYEKKLFEFDNQFDYDEVIKGSKLNISKKEEEANTKNWIDLSTSFLK